MDPRPLLSDTRLNSEEDDYVDATDGIDHHHRLLSPTSVNSIEEEDEENDDDDDEAGTDGDTEEDGLEKPPTTKKKKKKNVDDDDDDSLNGYYSDQSDHKGSTKRSKQYNYSSKKRYVSQSDGALSEDERMVRNRKGNHAKKAIQKRLPMIPSRARFRDSQQRVTYNSYNTLPRKIPRRIKGKFRRTLGEHEMITGRVAVYCASNEIDLDEVYARMLQVRQEVDSKFNHDIPIGFGTQSFSIETNRTAIVPTIHPVKSTGVANPDTVDSPTWTASIFFDVLHLRQRYDSDITLKRRDSFTEQQKNEFWDSQEDLLAASAHREVFLFGFGCLVFWNWDSESAEQTFVRSLVPYSQRFYDLDAAGSAADDMEYFYGKKSSVKNDKVELSSGDPFERLAVSFAFAQSSLLSMYEFRLDQIIERNEHIPVHLAQFGKIRMSQEEISKEIGRLFMERNMINLESELMGTPTAFWEHDEWEPVYRKMCNYMEQEDRLEILNKRLDCVRELLDVLASQVENQHASKLEWIIIWLILSELLVSVVWGIFIKDIGGYFNNC